MLEDMPLVERLEKYRMLLKQLDITTKALAGFGFIRDEEHSRMEKLMFSEIARTDLALGALGKPPVPQLPGRERLAGKEAPGLTPRKLPRPTRPLTPAEIKKLEDELPQSVKK